MPKNTYCLILVAFKMRVCDFFNSMRLMLPSLTNYIMQRRLSAQKDDKQQITMMPQHQILFSQLNASFLDPHQGLIFFPFAPRFQQPCFMFQHTQHYKPLLSVKHVYNMSLKYCSHISFHFNQGQVFLKASQRGKKASKPQFTIWRK